MLAEIEWPELIVTPHEALRWFETALEPEGTMPSELVHAQLLRHRLKIEWLVGRPIPQREKIALAAVDAARRAGDPNEIARALGNLAATYGAAGRFDEAERAFAEAYGEPERLANHGQRLAAHVGREQSSTRRRRGRPPPFL